MTCGNFRIIGRFYNRYLGNNGEVISNLVEVGYIWWSRNIYSFIYSSTVVRRSDSITANNSEQVSWSIKRLCRHHFQVRSERKKERKAYKSSLCITKNRSLSRRCCTDEFRRWTKSRERKQGWRQRTFEKHHPFSKFIRHTINSLQQWSAFAHRRRSAVRNSFFIINLCYKRANEAIKFSH